MRPIIPLCLLACSGLAALGASAEEAKKPAAQYLMSVATENMSIPGMPGTGGGLEGMMSSMGMGAMGVGPRRSLWLDLLGPETPPSPGAEHLIPPGLKMGSSLPLRTPAPGKGATHETGGERQDVRILLYWGCGDAIRPGQPKVLDTAKMSPEEYGPVLVSRKGSGVVRLAPRKGWTYGEWPNPEKQVPVPADGSLQGDHVVKGNYTPDIKFSLDQRRDFMEPVVFTRSEGGLADAIRFEWRAVPGATGYFMMAIGGHEGKKEVILWNSSEVQEVGGALMGYVAPATVRKYIKEKVVFEPGVTRCTIPKGIFQGAEGAVLQLIAYGEEANFAHPPKPADPKAPWNPVWTAKVRLKSTGMLMLGEAMGATAGEPASAGKDEPRSGQAQQAPAGSDPVQDAVEGAKKLKGLLGF